MKECQLSDMEASNSIALLPCKRDGATRITADAPEMDAWEDGHRCGDERHGRVMIAF